MFIFKTHLIILNFSAAMTRGIMILLVQSWHKSPLELKSEQIKIWVGQKICSKFT